MVPSIKFSVTGISQIAAGAAERRGSDCRTESESEGVAVLSGRGTQRTDHRLRTRQRYREQLH